MHFSRLRLSGFKSFVDPIELRIEPGLTGVVGPNGCGKSNLLEALRWVMGENSAKSMRGAGMDDVIFAGTAKRPPRNLADVTLIIDNKDRRAPAAFNHEELLEVTRRIERDSGSAYRINGKDVRAKDVQLLFADAATGAHSPALVSQGRIGALVTAKPKERRAILEEAAGISGLHSRRKEAESRLRSAENNLVRLQDVVGQLETQTASLKRQARQARRYREMSGEIRQTEAIMLYIRWRDAAAEVEKVEAELREAERAVAAATQTVAGLSREQASTAETLPAKRQREAEAAAALQRLQMARESLENEEKRRLENIARLEQSIEQIDRDRSREAEMLGDSDGALARLDKEKEQLEQAGANQADRLEKARAVLDEASARANETEKSYDEASEKAAGARARRSSLESDLSALQRRLDRLRMDRERLARDLEALTADDQQAQAVATAQAEVKATISRLEKATDAVGQAEASTASAREAADTARQALSECRAARSGIEAEIKTLERMLADGAAHDFPPVTEALTVEPGWEEVLGIALGDDLEAALDQGAPRHWLERDHGDDPALPEGCVCLADHVDAPAALQRRLRQVGVAESSDQAAVLAKHLKPGQRLVTADGGLWRWDGFIAHGSSPSAAAVRLQQKNRLTELQAALEKATMSVEAAASRVDAADAAHRDATQAEASTRTMRREAENDLSAANRTLATAEQEASRRASRLGAIKDSDSRLERDEDDAKAQVAKVEAAIADLPAQTGLEEALADLRREVEAVRSRLAEARAGYDSLRREGESRQQRLEAIGTEHEAWTLRRTASARQIKDLDERREQATEELAGLTHGPEDHDARRTALLTQIDEADAARKAAADALAQAENALAEKDRALKQAEATLADVRERRIRHEAARETADSRRRDMAQTIGERFKCPPAQLLEKMEVADVDNLPLLQVVEAKLEKLKAERERLGAVNLRADEELAELEEQMAGILAERADLEQAIHRLRGAIGSLNREGRERLLAAFEEVNAKFTELFTSLFGGGTAHLELVESDDPLDAGIEIMASPPGKRLQSLSLLSGGEQALTALSLIFAVFLTNPAPICVLDEVDAPLDDANVERFCDLLDEMTRQTDTRFLIVTHNAVTMSRVNRLFGVTMAERGVSQLVSVDLEAAAELREAS